MISSILAQNVAGTFRINCSFECHYNYAHTWCCQVNKLKIQSQGICNKEMIVFLPFQLIP